MILDLIEVDVKPKKSKFKIITCIIIILLVLAIPTMFLIKYFQTKSNDNILEKSIDTQEVIINNVENENNNTVNETKNNEVPKVNLTSIGINNIQNIYHSDEKRAFLTFDDGPSINVTPLILDTLRNENVKASFFVLGSRVELYPELVKQEYDEGHYIANHGYSHVYAEIYSSVQAVLDEYFKTQDAIREALQMPEYNSYIFRFPGGSVGGRYASIKSQAKEVLQDNNIAYIDWNALTSDATGQDLTEDEMFDEMIYTTTGKNSVVILMHDASDKIKTANLLPRIIEYLRNEGYTFENFYSIIE